MDNSTRGSEMDRNKRILVVDDQHDLREQLAKLLERSSKKNDTSSLVQQMRAKLLGQTESDESEDESGPEDEGYHVDTVGQGKDAFEKVKEKNEGGEPYALMFLDMRMPPGWDGLETAKRIREIDKNLEIVIMTAYADHDQSKIAKEVGTPEKLLYIKKPFQAEEIFQLALSLTTKWTQEQQEKVRKDWLETLLRCMCKIKTVTSLKDGAAYQNTLKAIFSFTAAARGFIAIQDSETSEWNVGGVVEMELSEAEEFITANTERLEQSRTTQSVEGKYFLPLKRNHYCAVVVAYDLVTHNDPEWYKLLSLLTMTASEVLSNAALFEQLLEQKGASSVS